VEADPDSAACCHRLPLLVLALIGARLILPRRGLGWFVLLLSVALIWLSACTGSARALMQFALHPPPVLNGDRIQALKGDAQAKRPVAIVVLGGGMEALAPEYGVSSLRAASLERLRYGVWLGRETGLPVAFSGGVGLGPARRETRGADRRADRGHRIRPPAEVDRRQLARHPRKRCPHHRSLKPQGIRHIVLVTHGYHMPRALHNFEQAAGSDITIEAAPMGTARRGDLPALNWMPSGEGFQDTRNVLRELVGRMVGA